MAWKFTDYMAFYPPVDKFYVANLPTGKPARKRVFVSIGPGGKGSETANLSPDDAMRLARYLMVEVHKALNESDEVALKAKGGK